MRSAAVEDPELAPQQHKMEATEITPDLPDIEITEVPLIAKIGTFVPLIGWLSMLTVVPPNHHQAIVHCGHVTSLLTESGIHCIWGCGDRRNITVMQQVMEVPSTNSGTLKVVDRSGSPLVVSAILNFRVVDATKALFAVADFSEYVQKNASAVLKQVVATHTYNELKHDVEEVNANMKRQLQPMMAKAGILVSSMVLNEMNYATEIASAMLKKQQAGALIEARELIVEGAVKISQDAIKKLEEGGVEMKASDKVRIITNLLTVTCSDRDASPTLPLATE
eukprot:TRINITY_DN23334_c0_g1_i8.p1 TRINITY_DN23334_c0_g1~~TRINITY_DN23334_c0_g1_i8.p1  ORF type:complete len:280 (-),score=56.71 TRINITY_DN23334_c0_g1_i8:194-1033(-)